MAQRAALRPRPGSPAVREPLELLRCQPEPIRQCAWRKDRGNSPLAGSSRNGTHHRGKPEAARRAKAVLFPGLMETVVPDQERGDTPGRRSRPGIELGQHAPGERPEPAPSPTEQPASAIDQVLKTPGTGN